MPSSRRASAALFKSEKDQSLDRALGECNVIRGKQQPGSQGLSQGLLLRCVDRAALYSYLHYAIYRSDDHRKGSEGSETGVSDALNARVKRLSGELKSPTSQFGAYGELRWRGEVF